MPLQTFWLPSLVEDSDPHRALGRELVAALQADGVFQVQATREQQAATDRAMEASRDFFRLPLAVKALHVSDLTYSGYVASGDGEPAGALEDGSEMFTICPDIDERDARVLERWPCHGPVPWPFHRYADAMKDYMRCLGIAGQRLLRLIALGLGLADMETFTRLTEGGWHHMRALRFPAADAISGRGISAHTDPGLLVIASSHGRAGGLYVRPPVPGEERGRNWLPGGSMAGEYEDEEPWTLVKPARCVFTVFPGDLMQFMTGGEVLAAPHRVRLAEQERYALAYAHVPAFSAVARPLDDTEPWEHIHYGTYITNAFMRCFPDRMTTVRIEAEGRLSVLAKLREADIGRI
ncbi:MAG TPA: 2-oxoglutarate and iron-dependent oxygenase domain-containing protein [Streptosporangiaceae bacterium]|nr:2-oxoglutarate and iron-dependent oxygenase domain-containing protein [Streptosporangiaceae bacterium]